MLEYLHKFTIEITCSVSSNGSFRRRPALRGGYNLTVQTTLTYIVAHLMTVACRETFTPFVM